MPSYFATIEDPNAVVMAIDTAVRFPEVLDVTLAKYKDSIDDFSRLIREVESSAALLERIRGGEFKGKKRMALLKMFRRAVSPVIDTEMAKKVTAVSTTRLVESYGETFKSIDLLKQQFAALTTDTKGALAALVGEYDSRGQIGYSLTGLFFEWFETKYEGVLTIEGPRGAGRDIELSSVLSGFSGDYPCDFVIRKDRTREVLAIGFARYDSTRGGAQSDDRTGGNSYKVLKAKEYCQQSGDKLRILFLADGPGLAHKDTWKAACDLDGEWDGNVRVTTMKLADVRVTEEWLLRVASR